MFGLGAGEIAIIGFLSLILIGPKKLPELARSLGKGFREFQKAKDDMMISMDDETQKEERSKKNHEEK